MVEYIPEEDIDILFTVIEQLYARVEKVPQYRQELSGIKKLVGVLQGVQENTYYPTILDKATYLLVQINKGHFFSNGNKRLALVVAAVFLGLNHFSFKDSSKDDYRRVLLRLFPQQQEWTDFDDFTPADFGTYNLSIVIAESGKHGISFDELKEKVKDLLREVTVKV